MAKSRHPGIWQNPGIENLDPARVLGELGPGQLGPGKLGPGQLGPEAETLKLTYIPQMLAASMQYECIYQQIYVPKTCAQRAFRHPSMFKTP